jgi:hypothetical protein
MLLSSLFLKNSYENYEKKQKNYFENYDYDNNSYLMFYISIIFFILELVLFCYAMIIIIKCSRNKHEFIIYTILSIIFTTPFVFFSMLSNECAKTIIQNL